MRYVLDADVLIGALDSSDSHHDRARRLFVAWNEQEDDIIVSVVNLSEVLVSQASDRGRLRAAREAIAALGVTVHAPTETIGVDASVLRNRHPISLADSYLLATARHTVATAVSFDKRIARAAKAEGILT